MHLLMKSSVRIGVVSFGSGRYSLFAGSIGLLPSGSAGRLSSKSLRAKLAGLRIAHENSLLVVGLRVFHV
jgi:hypothetical protein